jgi:hypothetical protein
MHITIDSASQFRDEFHRAGRKDQFSYEALGLLFDCLSENPDYELDVIEICCDFTEAAPEEIALMYDIDGDVMEYLFSRTLVAGVTNAGSIVFGNF